MRQFFARKIIIIKYNCFKNINGNMALYKFPLRAFFSYICCKEWKIQMRNKSKKSIKIVIFFSQIKINSFGLHQNGNNCGKNKETRIKRPYIKINKSGWKQSEFCIKSHLRAISGLNADQVHALWNSNKFPLCSVLREFFPSLSVSCYLRDVFQVKYS